MLIAADILGSGKLFCFFINIPLGLDFSVWDLNTAYIVDPEEFQSMGKATPFTGIELTGRCLLTVCDGNIVWQEKQ